MYQYFWEDRIQNTKIANSHVNGDCPLCDDNKRKFHGNIETGQWDCKVCGESGNAITYLQKHENKGGQEVFNILKDYGINGQATNKATTPPKEETKDFKDLSEKDVSNITEEQLQVFSKDRGLKVETLKKCNVGMDEQGYYTIPILDRSGKVVNIKRKLLGKDTISIGGGRGYLFGIEDLLNTNNREIYVVEGCFSAMAFQERGYKAVGIDSAGSLKDQQIDLFKGKDIILVPDNDTSGNNGMAKVANKLLGIASTIKTVDLTGKVKKGQDIRDYFKNGGIKEEFDSLVSESKKSSITIQQNPIVPQEEDEIKGFGFVPIGQLKVPRLKWFINNILVKSGLVIISGPPKAGKSTLLLHLLLCLSKGYPFLGHFKTIKTKCLVFTLEDNKGESKDKVKRMNKGKQFPRHFNMSLAESISLPDDFKRISIDIEDSKAKVVCIDTLRRSHSCNEDSSTDMAPIMKGCRELIRKNGVTVVLIHHTGHTIKNKNKSGDYLRGTSDIDGSWEVLIGIIKNQGFTDMSVFHKYRSDIKGSYKVISDKTHDEVIQDYPIVDLVYDDPNETQNTDDDKAILTCLQKSSSSANKLENELKGIISRPRIDASLDRLNTKGKIKKAGLGKNTRWGKKKNTSI